MNSISSSSSAPTKLSLDSAQTVYLQKMARFFFLVTLDEEVALSCTRRATQEFLKKSSDEVENLSERLLVQVCYFSLKKLWTHRPQAQNFQVTFEKGWQFDQPVDLSSWAVFRGQSDRDEFAAVIFCRILKVSERAVAEALQISLGTLRLRLARGLRSLGRYQKVPVQ